MPGSNNLSAAARLHVVKTEPPGDMQGKGKGKNKSKGQGKGKGKSKGHVRDCSPVRDLAGSNHGADHWDDLLHAWAGELSQSKKGGQPQQQQQHRYHPNNHPNNQPSGSGSGQNSRGRGGGGHAHAGQKRRATTETGTNGPADDGGQAAKRHKSERRPPKPAFNPGSGAPEPHPDFWHPDGSVVVQVENTKFRLHQSTLQKHSAYFATLFGGSEKNRRGGRSYLEVEVDERSPNVHIPVYRVAETTADDFATLLTVIEEPMCVLFCVFRVTSRGWKNRSLTFCCAWGRIDRRKYAEEAPPMPVLAGVLRAAGALSFDAQLKWAERIFERMWPATLDTLTTDAIPHAAVALALARNCGLRGVQKRASYELLRTPTFGQAIVVASPAEEEGSRADLLRLLHAREQLSLVWAEVAGKAPTDYVCPRGGTQMPERGGGGAGASASAGAGSSNGSDGRRCASGNVDRVHARWAELVHTTGLYVQRMVDPLMGLQDLAEIAWREEGFCKKCVAARTNAWDELRRKLWDDLDVWLELTAEDD